jgi:putative transposase
LRLDLRRIASSSRDSIYDEQVRPRIASLGITEVVSSPLSPGQNPYVERVVGSIRRECLYHVIILNYRHLRRMLRAYLAYYIGAGRISA